MKQLFTFLLLTIMVFSVAGQESLSNNTRFVKKNSVQLELFGHGLIYSLNYERVILNGSKFKTLGQVGFSYYPPQTGLRSLWIPIGVNELISFNQHHIEFGIGHVFTKNNFGFTENHPQMEWNGLISGRLGYRFQKPDGRWVFRIGFTPFFEYRGLLELYPSGGILVGYNF